MTFKAFCNLNIDKVNNKRSIPNKRFYIYRITNKTTGIHYYGSRICDCDPADDIGVSYFSSSYDKEFQQDQKINRQCYKYKVVRICKSNVEKQLFESYLHLKFNVKDNPLFYNKVNQTVSGFDCSGHEYNKGRKLTDETKRKLSAALTGRKMSYETRKRQSEAAFQRTPEQNKLRGVKHKGKTVSDSTRKVQSANNKGGGNPSARIIIIFDSLGNVIAVCHGTFRHVCEVNGYPWATLRQAKHGKRLYTASNGVVSTNITEDNKKFVGWYITIEKKETFREY